MIIPEIFNIICNYLPARNIILILSLNNESLKYIYLLSKKNIKKIIFANKNYFSVDCEIFKNNSTLFKNNDLQEHLIKTQNTQIIKYLVENNLYPEAYYNFLFFAIEFGFIELVKLLVQDNKIYTLRIDDYTIGKACKYGNKKIVKLLMKDKRVDFSSGDNYAIRYASEYGNKKIVKLLMKDKRVDPSDVDNYAIKKACENGHIKTVKLLLKDDRVDVGADNDYAIKNACMNNHFNIVKYLIENKHVDIYNTYTRMYNTAYTYMYDTALKNGYDEIFSFLISN